MTEGAGGGEGAGGVEAAIFERREANGFPQMEEELHPQSGSS